MTRSARESATIFVITTPRCCFMVFSADPSSAAICLLSNPAETKASTCLSRQVISLVNYDRNSPRIAPISGLRRQIQGPPIQDREAFHTAPQPPERAQQ
jgi:hypothetical protein